MCFLVLFFLVWSGDILYVRTDSFEFWSQIAELVELKTSTVPQRSTGGMSPRLCPSLLYKLALRTTILLALSLIFRFVLLWLFWNDFNVFFYNFSMVWLFAIFSNPFHLTSISVSYTSNTCGCFAFQSLHLWISRCMPWSSCVNNIFLSSSLQNFTLHFSLINQGKKKIHTIFSDKRLWVRQCAINTW